MKRQTVFLCIVVALLASIFIVSAALAEGEVSGDLMIYTSSSENFISIIVEKFNIGYSRENCSSRAETVNGKMQWPTILIRKKSVKRKIHFGVPVGDPQQILSCPPASSRTGAGSCAFLLPPAAVSRT